MLRDPALMRRPMPVFLTIGIATLLLVLIPYASEHAPLTNVAGEEQQVVNGHRSGERGQRGQVARLDRAEDDVVAGDLDGLAQTLLPANQESSFGHIRLTALGPAMRLTWPPLRTTCSLSAEPTIPISGSEAAVVTM